MNIMSLQVQACIDFILTNLSRREPDEASVSFERVNQGHRQRRANFLSQPCLHRLGAPLLAPLMLPFFLQALPIFLSRPQQPLEQLHLQLTHQRRPP